LGSGGAKLDKHSTRLAPEFLRHRWTRYAVNAMGTQLARASEYGVCFREVFVGELHAPWVIEVDVDEPIGRMPEQDAKVLRTAVEKSVDLVQADSELLPLVETGVLAAGRDRQHRPSTLHVFNGSVANRCAASVIGLRNRGLTGLQLRQGLMLLACVTHGAAPAALDASFSRDFSASWAASISRARAMKNDWGSRWGSPTMARASVDCSAMTASLCGVRQGRLRQPLIAWRSASRDPGVQFLLTPSLRSSEGDRLWADAAGREASPEVPDRDP
jgi:hypothetical protein